MSVRLLAPGGEQERGAEEVLRALDSAPSYQPFADELLDMAAALSAAIFKDTEAKIRPELQALAFWMRRAEVHRLRDEFAALSTPRSALVPRGLVFHVPPANVDTIFVYSWLLAALTGNRNVVRLSTKTSPVASVLCRLFNEVAATPAGAPLAATAILTYPHDDAITAAISARADARVIWGGNRTVSAIRAIAIPPHAKELTFPDRASVAALRASAYLALPDEQRQRLAHGFFNDTFWFDQLGCSSPRLVIWEGEGEDIQQAAGIFWEALAREAEGRYAPDTGAVLTKLSYAYRAIIDAPVSGYTTFGNMLTVLPLSALRDAEREHCGVGLLFQFGVRSLTELVPFVERRHQTLTHFGFSADDLRTFARALNGRGVDRMVPVGEALTFNRYWDGFDLLQELTRRVYIDAGTEHAA